MIVCNIINIIYIYIFKNKWGKFNKMYLQEKTLETIIFLNAYLWQKRNNQNFKMDVISILIHKIIKKDFYIYFFILNKLSVLFL